MPADEGDDICCHLVSLLHLWVQKLEASERRDVYAPLVARARAAASEALKKAGEGAAQRAEELKVMAKAIDGGAEIGCQ